MLRVCSLVVKQVHMVTGGTGYHDGIHRMVAMVDALLAEPILQLNGHIGNLMAFAIQRCEAALSCELVQALETWQNDSVPHVVHAPILLQAVGNGAIT